MQKKILYIDDDPDILEAVKIILEGNDYVVKTASDLTSLKEIIFYNPNLILLDILLNGKSGREVAMKIKSTPQLENTPLIIISAHTLSKLKQIKTEWQANGFLQKPFDMDVLLTTIKYFLK